MKVEATNVRYVRQRILKLRTHMPEASATTVKFGRFFARRLGASMTSTEFMIERSVAENQYQPHLDAASKKEFDRFLRNILPKNFVAEIDDSNARITALLDRDSFVGPPEEIEVRISALMKEPRLWLESQFH